MDERIINEIKENTNRGRCVMCGVSTTLERSVLLSLHTTSTIRSGSYNTQQPNAFTSVMLYVNTPASTSPQHHKTSANIEIKQYYLALSSLIKRLKDG